MMSERAVEQIFSLFDKFGSENYIGENVSQLQHAQQAAALAQREGYEQSVILGAFLHDIGHLVGMERGLENMKHGGLVLGIVEHDKVGEQFLEDLGFPKDVTQFVRGHVQAKRYLVYKYPEYHASLTEASKGTLVCQGGPMDAEEAKAFEELSNFQE